jgi:hypothetical protein
MIYPYARFVARPVVIANGLTITANGGIREIPDNNFILIRDLGSP